MRITSVLAAGATVASFTAAGFVAAPAKATGTDPVKIYPYQSSQNYCPADLQPVSINGVICCGTPDQTISYQQVMAHGGASRRSARDDCPIGVKGCGR